ncbi:5-methylcytosine-specific restriction enzyme B [BD1-7 clade bacterium]|nr:5-methylcytosine-specific restriction enzyme B [BD1-7 clade bacterium]
MARYCGKHDSEATLAAALQWRDECLIEQGSIFSSGSLWNEVYLEDLKRHFSDNLDEGEGGFLQKFESQLEQAKPETKQLASEMLWFMLLPLSNIGPDKKRENIQEIWAWSGGLLALPHTLLSDDTLKGVGSGGTSYNQNRWRELVYFIEVMLELRKLPKDMFDDLIQQPFHFARWLDAIDGSKNRQLRHILLFLIFPESFERVFAAGSRRNIIVAFRPFSRQQVNHMLPSEIDAELFEIRKEQQARYPGTQLDFYMPPLASLWRESDADCVVSEPSSLPYQLDRNDTMSKHPLNTIFYGPPGTGKTYNTVSYALSILEPDTDFSQHSFDTKKKLYDDYVTRERIRFCTFHQSFSYEDFVEGLRADSDDEGTVSYEVKSGIFKDICEKAKSEKFKGIEYLTPGARVWKVSLEGAGPGAVKTACFDRGEIRIGWGDMGDLSDYDAVFGGDSNRLKGLGMNAIACLEAISHDMSVGDIVVSICSKTNIEAVGIVKGKYFYDEKGCADRRDYQNALPIDWIIRNINVSLTHLNGGKSFTLKTLYELKRISASSLFEHLENSNVTVPKRSVERSEAPDNYVLIVDEINRGNLSSIFGELITLIEPSKRGGNPEAVEVTLPYSGSVFSVPKNLHIVGTMNTADRSLALVDTALRRRFDFVEMMPDYAVLKKRVVRGIDLALLLQTMNNRIEYLYDREHTLGHAFFMPVVNVLDDVGDENVAFDVLRSVFKNKILPLLQEYFYDDWQRIALVLGDNQKLVEHHQFVQKRHSFKTSDLFGQSTDLSIFGEDKVVFELAAGVFDVNDPQLYIKIYNPTYTEKPSEDEASAVQQEKRTADAES